MAVATAGVLVLAGGTPLSQRSDASRAQSIAEELKCLQCAGESVAASQAPLAQEFRDEIDRQLAGGASDAQVIDWFVDRYGEQVLLDPPTSGLSVLVWVLPVILVLVAVGGLWFAIRRWRRNPDTAPGRPVAGPSPSPGATDTADDAEGGSRGSVPVDAGPPPVAAQAPRWRLPAIAGALVLFAVLSTWLVTSLSADRGGAELTGGTGTDAGALARCQPLARTDPEAAIKCFDEILTEDPTDVAALTYRGWAHIRAGDVEAGREDLRRAVELDPDAADPHVFLAVAASDEGDFEGAAAELARFWANDPSEVAKSVVASEGLEREIFFGLMSTPTRNCWAAAAKDRKDSGITQSFLDELGACLDGVLAADPGDRDARLSRALAHLGPDTADPAAAREILEGLLVEDPEDSDALALLVSLELASGDLDAAEADLVRLERLPRGPAAFLIGDAPTLRAALEAAREDGQ